jgi:hypothetical protein
MKTLIICLLLMVAGKAFSQWKFSGQAGTYFNQLGIGSSTVTQSQRGGLIFDFKLDYKFESSWKFKFDSGIRTDIVARDSSEFFQLVPKNIYFQKKVNSLQLKFGLQTLSIDGPDIINPADLVNPKNWIDPTSPLTMGSPGLSISQEMDEWNWELFYIPRQTAPVLPGEHSPWLPRENRLPIESQNLIVEIPDNVRYQHLKPLEVNSARDNNFAFKIQRKSEHLEAQLLYYNGLSQTPFLTTQVQGTLLSMGPDVILVDSPVKLRPLYYRHQAVAGTFLLPFDSWAIRGGFNWMKPQGYDSRLPKETNMMVLGFEKNFEASMGIITGIFDFVKQQRMDANQISFLRSIFEEAVTGGVRVPLGEETTLFAGGLYDLIGHSSLFKFSVNHRLSNAWSLEGGGQFLQGPDDTMIGIYQRHDSFQFKLLYSW